MSKTTRKNKSNKTSTGRRSMKGKWGKVGAPPKNTSYPSGTFTMATLFNRNKNQCQLSLRNKVDDMLVSGDLIQLKSRRQAHGGVGRPKAVFILKEHFDATAHEKLDKPVKIRKPRQAATAPVVASTEPVAPATPPPSNVADVAISTTEPVASAPVEPAPIVTLPETNETPAPTQQLEQAA